jgi:hypothetical protein
MYFMDIQITNYYSKCAAQKIMVCCGAVYVAEVIFCTKTYKHVRYSWFIF